MKKLQLARLSLLFFLALFVLSGSSLAQHFVRMTDEQRIELALDMIRKGIQQQDTAKVLMVLAPEVSIKGAVMKSRADFSRELQTIFGSSHNREIALQKPAFPRADNPLHLSNFWDFDILDPKITIDGDSAVVQCQLVLWGSAPDDRSRQRARRTDEKLVFRTPPPDTRARSLDAHGWPASPSGKNRDTSFRGWKLEGFDGLLHFLTGELDRSHKQGQQRQRK